MRNCSSVTFALVMLLGACGGSGSGSSADAAPPDAQAIAHSAPVIINFSVKSGDASGGLAAKEKKLDTEAGDPYKAFIDAARVGLSGADPSRVEIASISLLLGAQTSGVASLQQVFMGEVEVVFIVDDTNNTFKAGHAMDPVGTGPVDFLVDFDHSMLGTMDKTNFLESNKVRAVIRGTAATGFEALNADAKLQVTFEFHAFE